MGLMCECNTEWCPEPGDWVWSGETRVYVPFPFKRRKRCCSCKELINTGDLAMAQGRARIPATDIECRIYGDDGEIPIASDWMCESCGDLYLSLKELGYCVLPRDDMRELVKEYATEQKVNRNNHDIGV